jgi:hypothetical protein
VYRDARFTECKVTVTVAYNAIVPEYPRNSWVHTKPSTPSWWCSSIFSEVPLLFGPDSSVGIATGYGLDDPGIESRWSRDLSHLSRPALEPTQPPVRWVPGLSLGKERPGRDADPSSLSSAVGHERVELYLYSPYGHYSLYRASVLVQRCTLPLPYSRAIPLLPLWAVRPVQSLSACTRGRFTFTLQ